MKNIKALMFVLFAASFLSGFRTKDVIPHYWQCQLHDSGRVVGDVLIYERGNILSIYTTSAIETDFGTLRKGQSINLPYVANAARAKDRYQYGDATLAFTPTVATVTQVELRVMNPGTEIDQPRQLAIAIDTTESGMPIVAYHSSLTCSESPL